MSRKKLMRSNKVICSLGHTAGKDKPCGMGGINCVQPACYDCIFNTRRSSNIIKARRILINNYE